MGGETPQGESSVPAAVLPENVTQRMNSLTLSWTDGRRVIAVLREKALPSMLDHVCLIDEQLETHGPAEAMVRLSLSDDVFHRSYNWARVNLGIPLPPD